MWVFLVVMGEMKCSVVRFPDYSYFAELTDN